VHAGQLMVRAMDARPTVARYGRIVAVCIFSGPDDEVDRLRAWWLGFLFPASGSVHRVVLILSRLSVATSHLALPESSSYRSPNPRQ
jgi:hypothetical protein